MQEQKSVNAKNESVESLLKKNIELTQAVFEQNKSIKRRLLYMVILGYIKIIIIVVPVIMAFIFLPPYLQGFWEQISGVLDLLGGSSTFPLTDIFKQLPNGDVLSK